MCKGEAAEDSGCQSQRAENKTLPVVKKPEISDAFMAKLILINLVLSDTDVVIAKHL